MAAASNGAYHIPTAISALPNRVTETPVRNDEQEARQKIETLFSKQIEYYDGLELAMSDIVADGTANLPGHKSASDILTTIVKDTCRIGEGWVRELRLAHANSRLHIDEVRRIKTNSTERQWDCLKKLEDLRKRFLPAHEEVDGSHKLGLTRVEAVISSISNLVQESFDRVYSTLMMVLIDILDKRGYKFNPSQRQSFLFTLASEYAVFTKGIESALGLNPKHDRPEFAWDRYPGTCARKGCGKKTETCPHMCEQCLSETKNRSKERHRDEAYGDCSNEGIFRVRLGIDSNGKDVWRDPATDAETAQRDLDILIPRIIKRVGTGCTYFAHTAKNWGHNEFLRRECLCAEKLMALATRGKAIYCKPGIKLVDYPDSDDEDAKIKKDDSVAQRDSDAPTQTTLSRTPSQRGSSPQPSRRSASSGSDGSREKASRGRTPYSLGHDGSTRDNRSRSPPRHDTSADRFRDRTDSKERRSSRSRRLSGDRRVSRERKFSRERHRSQERDPAGERSTTYEYTRSSKHMRAYTTKETDEDPRTSFKPTELLNSPVPPVSKTPSVISQAAHIPTEPAAMRPRSGPAKPPSRAGHRRPDGPRNNGNRVRKVDRDHCGRNNHNGTSIHRGKHRNVKTRR